MTQASFATHEVLNQSPPFEDVDLFALDTAAGRRRSRPMAAARREKELSEFGRHWGSAAMAARGRLANENTPKLRTFDSRGNRRDEVEFHPAYHELMAHSAHAGVHNSTWNADGTAGRRRGRSGARREILYGSAGRDRASVPDHHDARVGRGAGGAAGSAGEDDAGHRARAPTIRRFAPWWTKRGMTLGMGMTEKQGGTDVRSNMTRAERDGDAYRITGHKWFMSAPMCDAFLVLAQADARPDLFLHAALSRRTDRSTRSSSSG